MFRLALEFLNRTLRCCKLLSNIVERLYNFLRQFNCRTIMHCTSLKMWSSFHCTYAPQNLIKQYYRYWLTLKKNTKGEEGCQYYVLHYYGLLQFALRWLIVVHLLARKILSLNQFFKFQAYRLNSQYIALIQVVVFFWSYFQIWGWFYVYLWWAVDCTICWKMHSNCVTLHHVEHCKVSWLPGHLEILWHT